MVDTVAEEQRQKLQQEVDGYVREIFEDYLPNKQDARVREEGKVIRDPIHGFQHLAPWEIEVLDCPLVQRLRYIHQTALAYLVYPSANHTRLEHSLGAAKIVRDVASALGDTPTGQHLFDPTSVGELRLAALLHDVGHGIFSHLSESLIELRWYDDLSHIKALPEFAGKGAAEILSYMLVNSEKFRDFMTDVIARHHLSYDVGRIAGYILGRTQNPQMDSYKADVITGPLDADKLDYIARDSYFTGIRCEADIPNIVRSLQVWGKPSGIGRSLIVHLSGASFVEQMHFARLLLFPAMYHHPKVRALECMIRGMFETIWDPSSVIVQSKLQFRRITDFLRLNDGEFIAYALHEPVLQRKMQRLANRTLLKRALHISASVIAEPLRETDYSELVRLESGKPEAQAEIRRLREQIFASLPPEARIDPTGGKLDVGDVWVDIPNIPPVPKDVTRCYVNTGEDEPLRLRELFPIDGWLQAYAENKWAAHVFGYPAEEHLKAANRAAISTLQERFQLKFLPRASRECKLEHPI